MPADSFMGVFTFTHPLIDRMEQLMNNCFPLAGLRALIL